MNPDHAAQLTNQPREPRLSHESRLEGNSQLGNQRFVDSTSQNDVHARGNLRENGDGQKADCDGNGGLESATYKMLSTNVCLYSTYSAVGNH